MKINAIYSYDFYSKSARLLSTLLNVPVLRHENSTFRGSHDKFVLNWGSGDLPREVRKCGLLNEERNVMHAINKVSAFKKLPRDRCVPWTESVDQVRAWLNEGARVFARTKVTGKDGEGLVEVPRGDGPIPRARLYTKYIRAAKEYRINVLRQHENIDHETVQVVSRQRKVRLEDHQGTYNDEIKTSSNGYGFKWVTRDIPPQVELVAKMAIHCLELDFGGVDVIWDGANAYILEVNTAPELTPNSAKALADKLKEYYPNE